MRRRRIWTATLGIVISLIIAAWPGCSTFTISTETTYITEPVDAAGYIDYATALNERLRAGISPEANANVLIWQAVGPRPEGFAMQPEYFKWLEIEPPAERGIYLVTWSDYVKQHAPTEDPPKRDANATEVLDILDNPWAAKDNPRFASWIKQNEHVIDLAMRASRRPNYYNPLVPKSTEGWSAGLLTALLPTVQKTRDLAGLLAGRAMLRAAEGRTDEAWQDLLACHRLARLLTRGGTIIELLVGFAIDRKIGHADLAFVEHAKLSSAQIQACLRDLEELAPMPCLADRIDVSERFVMLECLMLSARQGMSFLEGLASDNNKAPSAATSLRARLFTRSIDWDPAFRNANRWIDRVVAVTRVLDRREYMEKLKPLNEDLVNLKLNTGDVGFMEKMFMSSERRGELIGDIVIALLVPALDRVRNAEDRWRQEKRNLQVAFALAAYRSDHGAYPAKLADLTPRYLKGLPNDLFADKPLVYRLQSNGYILYSVGVNGIDDDAHGDADEPPGDDLYIQMPARTPKAKP